MMDDDKTYIVYSEKEKIDIMDVDKPLLLDQMVEVNENSDINKIKTELKSRVDNLAKVCEEKRGPVKDALVIISVQDKPGYLEKVQGPVWEVIKNHNTNITYLRYGRSIEFI